MPSSSALSRRKGGASHSSGRIPWEYIGFVAITVLMVFFFLYVKALNNVVHHDKEHYHDKHNNNNNNNNIEEPILVLKTNLGNIQIQLRQDLSRESADYIRQIISSGQCPRCNFYRAEEHGILQGIIKDPNLKAEEAVQIPKGACPTDLKDSKYKNNCHGPVMTHGMVGWAGGKTGPDFFIDWYKQPAKFWGAQHTVWGHVLLEDEESVRAIEQIWTLPVNKKGLTYLVDPIKFTMELVS
jgi:cyclophilin family peptidyl-prolyl cis-trans isomerase